MVRSLPKIERTLEMSEEPEWEMIESGWHCYSRKFESTLGAALFLNNRWHCYIGDDASAVNFATLKEAKQYIEEKTK